MIGSSHKTLYGVELWPSPLLVETKIGRIRGGYMNRWLIRAVVTVPSRRIIHDRINNRIYCHPQMLAEIKRKFASAYPSFGSLL